MGETSGDGSGRVRPVAVWLITIYYALAGLWTGLGFLLIHTGVVPLNDAQKIYFQGLGTAEWIQAVLGALLSLVFAVQLFKLRANAIYILIAVFAVNGAATIWHAVTTNWVEVIGSSGLVGTALAWALLIAILVYCYRLRARGLLT